MGTIRKNLIIAAAMMAASGTASADNFWFGVKAGTTGIGLEGAWRPIDWLDLRLGANKFDYEESGSQGGNNYDGTLALESYHATANMRFPLSPFRISVGAYSNGNAVNLVSGDNPSFVIGGEIFTPDEVGTLRSETTWDDFAPYLGAGFDFEIMGRVGLNFDLGVLWQGDPYVTLTADGTLAGDPAFQNLLEQERLELVDDLDALKAYPVASLGFNFNF